MFRFLKTLTKPQPVLLQTLYRTSKFALAPLHHFTNKTPYHKTLSYHLSAAPFSSFSFTKRPENQYIQDLDLIQDCSDQQLASYKQIIKKYIASQDFADFTQEDITHLLATFDHLAKNCFNFAEREGDALKYYEEAFAFVKAIGMKDSKEIGFLHHGMAYALFRNQKLDEAFVHFGKSQEMLEKAGLDNESFYSFIQTFYYQGVICYSQKNFDKAEKYFQVALEGSEQIPDEVSEKEAFQIEAYSNLAIVYFKKNSLEKAREYAIKALGRIDKVFGEFDHRKIGLLSELASTLYKQGKLDEALGYAKKLHHVLTHDIHQVNENEVLQNSVLLAHIYTKKNDPGNASTNWKQAIEILEKSPGSFPEAHTIYPLAAEFYFTAGKVQEATELFNKGINIIRNKFGENSFETAFQLNSWARTLETNKNTIKEAYDAYKKSLEISQKLGDQHIIGLIHNTARLADLARQLGNYEEAVEFAQRALKLCTERGQNPQWLEDINSMLGSSLVAKGKEAEGLKHFEEAARLCEKSGDKSGGLFYHYYLLADAYFKRKDMESAEETAKKALKLCASKFGNGNPNTQSCLSLLLRILNAQKKADDILKLRQAFGMK